MTSVPRRLSAGWDSGQRLVSAEELPERPGLRRAAMTGGGEEPRCAVVQAERSCEEPTGARVLAADAASEVEACEQLCSCCLTFELTATRAARRLGGVAQHKRRRYDAQAACRVGSRLSEGLGRTPVAAKVVPRDLCWTLSAS